MNKTVVLIFIGSLFMTSGIASMNWDSDKREKELDEKFNLSSELIFQFSSEEDEIDSDTEECSYSEAATWDSTKLAAWIGNDPQQCPIAAFSVSSSEETESITCPYCDASLFNISFEFIEHDNKFVCVDCVPKRPWLIWAAAEDHALLDVSSASSEIDSIKPGFQDDEPLFDHKKGNARSHAISRHYRAKTSSIRALEKEICSWPMNKQKLRSLLAQKDLALASKRKLPNQ
jgi:hypothetical protein